VTFHVPSSRSASWNGNGKGHQSRMAKGVSGTISDNEVVCGMMAGVRFSLIGASTKRCRVHLRPFELSRGGSTQLSGANYRGQVHLSAPVLTPLQCSSRLDPKEPRNSSKSGTHLRQTGGFFIPAFFVGATDAMPASGGRLIQHPQGEYARRLLAVSSLPTSRPSSCRGRTLLR
jgi:hypothetical protein